MALSGCATAPHYTITMDEKIRAYRQSYATVDCSESVDEPVFQTDEELTLDDALSLALAAHPHLRVAESEVDAAQGRVLQEGLWLNPSLGVEVENFGGSGEYEGFDAAEITVALGQLIEWGGKRSKRRTLAELEQALSEWQYVMTWLDVVADTSTRFVAMQAALRVVELAQAEVEIAQQMRDAVTERVKAGRDTILEEMKAKSMLASAELGLIRARSGVVDARENLMLMWSTCNVQVERVSTDLMAQDGIPPVEKILAMVDSFPEMQRQQVEVEMAAAMSVVARAARIPDVEIEGGYKQSRGDDEQMLVAGVGVSLPLFDRNQGGIHEASTLVQKVYTERLALKKELRAAVRKLCQQNAGRQQELQLLERQVLPGAQAVFDAAEEGYRAGKYTYLDMLDAEQSLLTAKREWVQLNLEYQNQIIELERLLGMKISSLHDADVMN